MTVNMQHQPLHAAAVRLQDNCIHLAQDGTMRACAKGGQTSGCILVLHRVNGPDDAHYPIWEMHPEGDELLILVSGSLAVEFHEEEADRTEPLAPHSACIVRAGIWHRLIVYEPSVLMAITPRHNTAHAKVIPPLRANT
jgi:mannose-6-phosphate isomerase-like protein (cupin superfamily)